MFQVKICGVTTAQDAIVAADAGADAIGLNFCTHSPRRIDPEQARDIASATPAHVIKVGVFANDSPSRIREVAATVGLDLVQLHGQESAEEAASLCDIGVIRAAPLASYTVDQFNTVDQALRYFEECHRLNGLPLCCLVDAQVRGQFGGTGRTVDWDTAARLRRLLGEVPVVLAGGLTPDNVAAGIQAVQPAAVDVSSGVELSPGRKDAAKVAAFVAAARRAFDTLVR